MAMGTIGPENLPGPQRTQIEKEHRCEGLKPQNTQNTPKDGGQVIAISRIQRLAFRVFRVFRGSPSPSGDREMRFGLYARGRFPDKTRPT
jgi:hypothetical protein